MGIKNSYNLIWNTDNPDKLRSEIIGQPVYDMKCKSCLAYIGSFTEPEECDHNYCHNCGKELKITIGITSKQLNLSLNGKAIS